MNNQKVIAFRGDEEELKIIACINRDIGVSRTKILEVATKCFLSALKDSSEVEHIVRNWFLMINLKDFTNITSNAEVIAFRPKGPLFDEINAFKSCADLTEANVVSIGLKFLSLVLESNLQEANRMLLDWRHIWKICGAPGEIAFSIKQLIYHRYHYNISLISLLASCKVSNVVLILKVGT